MLVACFTGDEFDDGTPLEVENLTQLIERLIFYEWRSWPLSSPVELSFLSSAWASQLSRIADYFGNREGLSNSSQVRIFLVAIPSTPRLHRVMLTSILPVALTIGICDVACCLSWSNFDLLFRSTSDGHCVVPKFLPNCVDLPVFREFS